MSEPLGQHIMLRTREGGVIAPEVAGRRLLVRTVVRFARDLLLFNCPDTHLHVAVTCPRDAAGLLAMRLGISLARRGHHLERAYIKPIASAYHLRHLARYIPGNAEHHGALVDPLHEASNIPDLLGLRLAAAHTLPRLQSLLPRWRPRDLLVFLGVDRLEPGTDLRLLVESAASAAAVPALRGFTPPVVQARVAAAHVGRALGATTGQLAELLGLGQRAVQKLLVREPDPRLVSAIRLQMGLRERLGSHASPY